MERKRERQNSFVARKREREKDRVCLRESSFCLRERERALQETFGFGLKTKKLKKLNQNTAFLKTYTQKLKKLNQNTGVLHLCARMLVFFNEFLTAGALGLQQVPKLRNLLYLTL